ncbi:MAG: potassium-transporting ATPase subunit [Phycisphaerales bacterium]|nr:potassium-transporting ATPase subunit [Phycisphaerales bacterium]
MNNLKTNMNIATHTVEEYQSIGGQIYTAVASTIILLLICCGLYPLLVWGIAQAAFPVQANGSLVTKAGAATSNVDEAVGSRWLGQTFTAPKYFHPRPSAAGAGYDASASSGTNLGPLSDKLLSGIHGSKNADGSANPSADYDGVKDLATAYRTENGMAADATVPADAVTRSASGLDPHISPVNAAAQVARIAKARRLSASEVQALIDTSTDGPSLGFLGEPGVNVLMLNLALDQKSK